MAEALALINHATVVVGYGGMRGIDFAAFTGS
jgi:hypothetical protein